MHVTAKLNSDLLATKDLKPAINQQSLDASQEKPNFYEFHNCANSGKRKHNYQIREADLDRDQFSLELGKPRLCGPTSILVWTGQQAGLDKQHQADALEGAEQDVPAEEDEVLWMSYQRPVIITNIIIIINIFPSRHFISWQQHINAFFCCYILKRQHIDNMELVSVCIQCNYTSICLSSKRDLQGPLSVKIIFYPNDLGESDLMSYWDGALFRLDYIIELDHIIYDVVSLQHTAVLVPIRRAIISPHTDEPVSLTLFSTASVSSVTLQLHTCKDAVRAGFLLALESPWVTSWTFKSQQCVWTWSLRDTSVLI